MKVFITGGEGFIGSHVVEYFVQQGHDVTCLTYPEHKQGFLDPKLLVKRVPGDVRNAAAVKKAMQGAEWVVHMAAAMNNPEYTDDHFFSVNVEGTRNVMAAALANGVKKVVHVSSIVAIKEDAKRVDEEHIHHAVFDGAYARTKFLGEKAAFEYGARGLPITFVHPTVVFGPRGYALSAFFKLHIAPRIRFRSFESTRLNMIYVKDVAKAVLLAMEKGKPGEKYIIGGEEISLQQCLELLDKVTGTRKPTVHIPEWLLKFGSQVMTPLFSLGGFDFPVPPPQVFAMQRGSAVDDSKAKRELGLTLTPLEDGMRETVQWMKDVRYLQA